MLTASKITEET